MNMSEFLQAAKPKYDKRTCVTLRDQFAMRAMKAFLADEHGHPTLESAAEYAYKMADAMLKEREK